jgi:hypothetical protein
MTFHDVTAASAAVVMLAMTQADASSCGEGIVAAQAAFDARLTTAAAAGPAAAESPAATLHHQPTPDSVARAEATIGDLPPDRVRAFEAAIERAREADAKGEAQVCSGALDEAERVLASSK